MKTIDRFDEDNFFLSNFAHSKIFLGNKEYETVEHFYQAGKAATVADHEIVRLAGGPGAAKRAGRAIKYRDDWEDIKVEYMKLGLILKFDIDELGDMLLATGDAILEEGNTWGDSFWGTVDGVGENKLGRLLMQVREDIPMRRANRRITTNDNTI